MSGEAAPSGGARLIATADLPPKARYQLLTSLVVPRPIGWISSRSAAGQGNLAPFSYFTALATRPMLVGVSIGSRRGSPKDTLRNIRETGAFCVNIVTERHMAAMNESAGDHPPEVDEFAVAGVGAAPGERVDVPYVADCPAVFECGLYREVDLETAGTVLVIGEVLAVRIAAELEFQEGTHLVDPHALRPVARLGGDLYAFLGEISALSRPIVE